MTLVESPLGPIPVVMEAVLLLGHGGPATMQFRRDVETPSPAPDEVLIRVGAAGVNNTDINTRVGWYSKTLTEGTSAGSVGAGIDGSWNGKGLDFPIIQGADVVGTIVASGDKVEASRIGQRVLVRSMQAAPSGDPTAIVTMGSEINGGFAQYCAVRSNEAFTIESNLTDAQLATFPCSYSTAEGMLERAGVEGDDRVLITGASGGVGSAAIQLAKRRGAEVIGIAAESKWADLEPLGPDLLLDRSVSLITTLGENAVDVVIDVVAGPTWPTLLEVLRPQGRYVVSGAVAGPIVELDVRTLYLKDLTLLGSTQQPRSVFENLIGYIERNEIVPILAGTYPLAAINKAQERFAVKDFVGNLALVPRQPPS